MIEFDNDIYEVNEEALIVTLCLSVTTSTLCRNVSILITTMDISATGSNICKIWYWYFKFFYFLGGTDYVQAQTPVFFNQNTTQNCEVINILDDTLVESTETFQVSLSTSDPIIFPLQSVSVTIIDNSDRKFSDIVLSQYSSFESVCTIMLMRWQ